MAKVLEQVQTFGAGCPAGRGQACKRSMQLRQPGQRRAERSRIPWPGTVERNARQHALHILNCSQDLADLLIRLVGPDEAIREAILRAADGRCDVNFSLKLPFLHMRAIPGFDTMVAKFTTDIPSLTAWGEPFLLGPGSIHVAHTPDEKIAKRELIECIDLYLKLAHHLLG